MKNKVMPAYFCVPMGKTFIDGHTSLSSLDFNEKIACDYVIPIQVTIPMK